MTGDITQDLTGGWFYRDNGDGTADNLSEEGPATMAQIKRPVVLVRGGKSTGHGDPLATRVALVLAARYGTR